MGLLFMVDYPSNHICRVVQQQLRVFGRTAGTIHGDSVGPVGVCAADGATCGGSVCIFVGEKKPVCRREDGFFAVLVPFALL